MNILRQPLQMGPLHDASNEFRIPRNPKIFENVVLEVYFKVDDDQLLESLDKFFIALNVDDKAMAIRQEESMLKQ